jgi:hypothetical protein
MDLKTLTEIAMETLFLVAAGGLGYVICELMTR